MAPEYGATCGIFPVDAETLRYLRLTGRSEEQIALVEAYYKEQGLFHTAGAPEAEYTQTLELDLGHRRAQRRRTQAPAGSRAAERRSRQLRPAAALAARAHGQAARHAHRRQLWQRATAVTDTAPSQTQAPLHVTSNGAKNASTSIPTLSRPRLGRHRRHHQLHQHLQSLGDDRRRPARQKSRRKRPHRSRRGSRPRSLPARASSPTTTRSPACCPTSKSCASTSSATAAPPASATPARCPPTSPRASTSTASSPSACSAAIATSRAASTSTCAPIYLMSPAARRRLRARRPHRPQLRQRPARHRQIRQARLPQRHLAHAGRSRRGHRDAASTAKASATSTPPSRRATPVGRVSASPRATSTSGSPTPPTSARRPTSTA